FFGSFEQVELPRQSESTLVVKPALRPPLARAREPHDGRRPGRCTSGSRRSVRQASRGTECAVDGLTAEPRGAYLGRRPSGPGRRVSHRLHRAEGTPMDSELQLQVLAHTPLTAIVRQALDDVGAEVEAWDATQIHGGIGAAGGGVYRFIGTASSARES